jgi:hypothetical protein
MLPRFLPAIAERDIAPLCRRSLPSRPLREHAAAVRDELHAGFRFVLERLPNASLFDGINSVIGRFISVFGPLGNLPGAVRDSNGLRASARPLGGPKPSFANIFPWRREITGRGESRRARVVLRARAV